MLVISDPSLVNIFGNKKIDVAWNIFFQILLVKKYLSFLFVGWLTRRRLRDEVSKFWSKYDNKLGKLYSKNFVLITTTVLGICSEPVKAEYCMIP